MPSNVDLSKRRRFQPPITSFFTSATEPVASDTPNVSHHHHYAAATFSPTPVVPSKVQSNLLTVGMRVRKSIADGYRTNMGKTQEKILPTTAVAQTASHQSYRGKRSHSELVAFSGTTADDYLVNDDGDAFSLPPSSQESVDSVYGVSGGSKRSLDLNGIHADDDDDEFDTHQGRMGRNNILSPNLGQSRRILPMRTSKIQPPPVDLDDFEEAAFLQRREEVDEEDVPMCGV